MRTDEQHSVRNIVTDYQSCRKMHIALLFCYTEVYVMILEVYTVSFKEH